MGTKSVFICKCFIEFYLFQKELEKKVENLSVKIDTLLSGENESNKILDDLGPAMDRIDKTYDLLKDIDESDEKFRKFFTDRVRF